LETMKKAWRQDKEYEELTEELHVLFNKADAIAKEDV